MSTYAVIGGTGAVGAETVAALRAAGEDVRALARGTSPAVDLASGAGLDEALRGIDVVIDASNGPQRRPEPVLVDGARRLVQAASRAGVGHLVLVSIVGIDEVPNRYYRAKLAQERIVSEGAVPWSIVRSTQFHEFAGRPLTALARRRLRLRSGAALQPVLAREVAAYVAEVARGPALRERRTVAGPEVLTVTELGRAAARAAGRRALVLPVPLPPRTGRPLRRGALTSPAPDRAGTTTFAQWLAR